MATISNVTAYVGEDVTIIIDVDLTGTGMTDLSGYTATYTITNQADPADTTTLDCSIVDNDITATIPAVTVTEAARYNHQCAVTDGVTATIVMVGVLTMVDALTGQSIATLSDCATYGYTAVTQEYLERAIQRVCAYTRQGITSGTSTVSLSYPYTLPQRPVVSITSVTDADGVEITAEEYTLRGQMLVLDSPPGVITVTYTHGFTTVPDEIKEVVCSIAARMQAAPAGLMAGYSTESADGEQIGYGADAYAGVAELTSAERRALDRLFPTTRRVPRTAMLI